MYNISFFNTISIAGTAYKKCVCVCLNEEDFD